MNLKQEYENWMETGELPKPGLCSSLMRTKYQNTLGLFKPSYKELCELSKEDISNLFWASGLLIDDKDKYTKFTPLRQAIVLLILVIHDEL